MARERTRLETKVLGMDVQRGIHVPPTLHHSDLAVSGRNALTTDGGNIVTLGGILHTGIPNGRRVWNLVVKGLQENLRLTPVELWGQVHRGDVKFLVTAKSACFLPEDSRQHIDGRCCRPRGIPQGYLQGSGS